MNQHPLHAHIRHTYLLAHQAAQNGDHPFGALLVVDGQVILTAQNTVHIEHDPTRHAEMNLVSQAARQFPPETLARATLFTSTEPCAMCSGAIYWAGIYSIVFGCSAARLGQIAGPSLLMPAEHVLSRAHHPVQITGPVLEDEGAVLHQAYWEKRIRHDILLDKIRTLHRAWATALADIPEAGWQAQNAIGAWSLKDLLAHLTWFEREIANLIEQRALVGSDLWNLPTGERNHAVYMEHRDLPLEKVQDEARQVQTKLVNAFQTLTDDELNDPSRFAHMPPDWEPWRIIAGSTYFHYYEHLPQLWHLLAPERGFPARL